MTQLTHVEPADLGEADRALKTKHRSMWASGNYAAVVTDLVGELGPILVRAAGIKSGDLSTRRSCGDGQRRYSGGSGRSRVIASDLTPELLEVGRKRAAGARGRVDVGNR